MISCMARPINPNIPTSEEMRDMYVTRSLSQSEIGVKYGVSQATITNWLKRYGIASRPWATPKFRILDEDAVRAAATVTVSPDESAVILGCSPATARFNMIRLGLYTDEKEENRRAKRSSFTPVPKIDFVNRDQLRELYITQGKSQGEIANMFGVSQGCVSNRVIEFGLEREAKFINRGYRLVKAPGNPRAHRDGTVKEHLIVAEKMIGRYLKNGEEVHHINLNKLDNSDSNLAVITEADHSRLHKYMERLGAYFATGGDRPGPFQFDDPSFWDGKWVNQIDLASNKMPEAVNRLIQDLAESADIGSVD